MNRRGFITRLTTGLIGLAVANKIDPEPLMAHAPQWLQTESALEQMRRIYNACTKGGKPPQIFHVGSRIFEAVESEMAVCMRFVYLEPPPQKTCAHCGSIGEENRCNSCGAPRRLPPPPRPNLAFKAAKLVKHEGVGPWEIRRVA